MNQRERIVMLKDKTKGQPFCLRSEEDQAILIKASPSNCLFLVGRDSWRSAEEMLSLTTYILKGEYEQEPEYIEIEIVLFNGSYCLEGQSPNNRGKKLCNVTDDQGFVCFHDPFSAETRNAGDIPKWMRALAAQDGDFKLHARFLKVT